MEVKQFAVAPLDSYAVRITSGVAYLGGILMLPLLFAYLSNQRWGGLLIPVALAVSLAVFLVLAYGVQPVAYHIQEKNLIVARRWLPALKIPLARLTGASFASALAGVPHKGLRFAFNPGVFGYQGPFYLLPYGRAFFMATNRERLISVGRIAAPPLVLSPARPRLFIEALNELIQKQQQAGQNQLKEAADTNIKPPDTSE